MRQPGEFYSLSVEERRSLPDSCGTVEAGRRYLPARPYTKTAVQLAHPRRTPAPRRHDPPTRPPYLTAKSLVRYYTDIAGGLEIDPCMLATSPATGSPDGSGP